MSRRGNCYDNATMESFWSTLKAECLAGKPPATHGQARQMIFEYIETYYNRVRLHSSLGYLSPVDFEKQIS
jgi:transposase InsO family protein